MTLFEVEGVLAEGEHWFSCSFLSYGNEEMFVLVGCLVEMGGAELAEACPIDGVYGFDCSFLLGFEVSVQFLLILWSQYQVILDLQFENGLD